MPLALLLVGFLMFDQPTWEKINANIEQHYPKVKHLDVDSLKASLDQGRPPVLIDVREKEEFAVSHLPNAINTSKAEEVSYPKDTPMVIYCSVGMRSAAFANELEEKGFTEIHNLRGSIFAWANKGYPLRRGTLTVKAVHPYDKKWGTLLNPELHMYRVDSPEVTMPGGKGKDK